REKLVEIASSSGEDRRARRSIRREMAALVVASAGLLLFSLGLFWLNLAAVSSTDVLDPPSYWAQFPAFCMVTTGAVALVVASVMALAGVFPWGRRRALCAALVLAAGATALLQVL